SGGSSSAWYASTCCRHFRPITSRQPGLGACRSGGWSCTMHFATRWCRSSRSPDSRSPRCSAARYSPKRPSRGPGSGAGSATISAPFPWQYSGTDYQGVPKLAPPSASHPFGTTSIRFDVLGRVIYGARLALEVVGISVGLAVAIGLPLGLYAGYHGGWQDRALVMVMDSLYAFPGLLLAIVVAAFLGRGVLNAAVAISVVYVP